MDQGVSWDPEDCEACGKLEDECTYHRGVRDGVNWVTQHLGNIAEDPEMLNQLAVRVPVLKTGAVAP